MAMQMTQTELEENIKSLNEENRASHETLLELESTMKSKETTSFELLQKLFKKVKQTPDANISDLEFEYHDSLAYLKEASDKHYKQLCVCHKQIQKLRSLENTYLVGLINSLQKDVEAAKSHSSSKYEEKQ